tara:strand:+ start:122 stop:523 length:402 start_codon:yes stop_codon:yes gene_type:complete
MIILYIIKIYYLNNNNKWSIIKMNKDKINKLIKKGYKPLVYLQTNKDNTKMILKTILTSKNSNIVYSVYYNHIKNILSKKQLIFIDSYNKAKNMQYNNFVELNIKYNNNNINYEDMQVYVMYKAIKNLTYLEQ